MPNPPTPEPTVMIFLAVLVALVMILAIAGTIYGMAKGDTFSLINWIFYSGEWFKILGECFVVILSGLASIGSSSD